MTTSKIPGSNPQTPGSPQERGGAGARVERSDVAVDYAGVGAFGGGSFGGGGGGELPSFWTALSRYRERHGLIDPQQRPIPAARLDDADLKDLRDHSPARDFSFDDLEIKPTSTSSTSSSTATVAKRED